MAETKERRKIEIDPAAMPEGYPCAKCEQTCNETCNGRPCIRFKVFYAEFMHRCRVATGCETPSREKQYRKYVETQTMIARFGKEEATTRREERGMMLQEKIKASGLTYRAVAERMNLSQSTIWSYMRDGVSEKNAARAIAAVEALLREKKRKVEE